MINFPNNPTGAVMTGSDLKAIADIVIENDLLLISDEVYAEMTYETHHCAPATISDLRERTITLNGFSKAYAMTGWHRYLCAPKELADAALKIHQYVMLCAPVMGQVGALEALDPRRKTRTAWSTNTGSGAICLLPGLTASVFPATFPKVHSTHSPQ